MTPSSERAARVKDEARALGFHAVGIAEATPLDPTGLDDWLARGRHGVMGYMQSGRDARVDPRLLLPGAKSVVVLAMNYWHAGDTELPGGGRVSRYAWGRDYHKLMEPRLNRLRKWVHRTFDADTWGGVDRVPLMEKQWAQRAGLGWVGKSGNLITRQFGTWVFLATFVTDLELAPDAPHEDQCGTCVDCIPACPTGAIVQPYVVDARRCISYHSIEHEGPWPADIAEASEGWIHGCDVCQDVCPWSMKFRTPSTEPDFAPRPEVMSRTLEDYVALDEAGWDELTRGSPLRREGREGLVRNARVATKALE